MNSPLSVRAQTFLNEEVNIALQNLQFCRCLCELFQDYGKKGERPKIVLNFGIDSTPRFESKNGGLIATPVIFSAIIDLRKIISFFGYTGTLKKRKKDKDDFDISDLGLPYPSYNEFISACLDNSFSRQELETALLYLLRYANKMIGHFTMLPGGSGVFIEYRKIDVACMGISRATRTLVYDALKIYHPNIQFNEIQT